jgi:hypothetical protein
MKSIFASLAAAAVFATSALAQLTINTPSNPVVCQPLLITWSGGTPPYYLSILPGNQPTAQALENFPTQTGTSLTWTVNIAVGTSIGFHIVDSTGASQDSAPFSILTGADTSCVGKNPSSSGGASSTESGTGAATTSAVVTTTSAPATHAATTTAPGVTTTTGTSKPTTTGTSKPATSGTTSAAGTTSSKASGAISQNAQFGAAGVVGAAIIALLA